MDDYNDKFLEYLFKTNSMIELWNERENILNGVAYHYTKYENIKKILSPEDPVFWCTQYQCLDDTTEGIHICDIYSDVCNELLAQNKINQDFYYIIKDLKPNNKSLFFDNEKKDYEKYPSDYFICCFTGNYNSNYMMENYADKNNGCVIGINFYTIRDRFNTAAMSSIGNANEINSNAKWHIFNIVYDDATKKEYIRNIIFGYYDFFGKVKAEYIKTAISENLQKNAFRFKKEKYSDEQEIRFLLEIQNGGTAVYPIKFTEDKTRSYIEMNLNNKRCFWDVFFGDNITIDQKTDIKNYLKENKYRTITW